MPFSNASSALNFFVLFLLFRLIFPLLFMAYVKHVTPIVIESEGASFPTDQLEEEEEEIPVVEIETALIRVKCL